MGALFPRLPFVHQKESLYRYDLSMFLIYRQKTTSYNKTKNDCFLPSSHTVP